MNRWAYRAALFGASFVILANSILTFRGWVVASRAEAAGAHIFFFFLGILPWVGVLAAARKKKWGAWLIIISATIASLGFLFVDHSDTHAMAIIFCITVLPLVAIGALLLRLLIVLERGGVMPGAPDKP